MPIGMNILLVLFNGIIKLRQIVIQLNELFVEGVSEFPQTV